MKHYLYLIILLSSFGSSCNYTEEKKISYQGYYDSAHTKLSLKGNIIEKKEEGVWEYYDEKGKIIKQGNFEGGFQKGKWTYKYPYFDKTIYWEPYFKLRDFVFSLPKSFKETDLDKDTSLYSAIDTMNGDVFSLKDLGKKSEQEVENYFDQSIVDFGKDYFVNESKSTTNKHGNLKFHFDTYALTHKASRKDLIMYSIYNVFEGNMLVFGYRVQPGDSVKAKVLLNDIFYHTSYKKKRVAIPFPELSGIIEEYQ